MCRNRDWFATYEIATRDILIMRNNSPCKITGIGMVRIKMFDGMVRTLEAKCYLLEYS